MSATRVLLLIMRGLACLRDGSAAAVGGFTLVGAPPSFQAFGVDSALAPAWSLALIVGSLLCLFAGFTDRRRTEAFGAFTIGAAYLVWAIAAGKQPAPTNTSFAVCAVLVGFFAAYYWRGLLVYVGVVPSINIRDL